MLFDKIVFKFDEEALSELRGLRVALETFNAKHCGISERAMVRQPIEVDDKGVVRFRQNKAVRRLIDEATAGNKCDINDLWLCGFPIEDMEQFYQLIGYSVSGFGDVEAFDRERVRRYDQIAERITGERK